jgi:hypothetical protein
MVVGIGVVLRMYEHLAVFGFVYLERVVFQSTKRLAIIMAMGIIYAFQLYNAASKTPM